MNTDSTTLYKLMILYMLSKVNFPLSNTQLSSFMLDKQYTDYFTFQETINSLVEDGFIRGYTHQSSTHYTLTKEGEETIAFFYTKISTAIRDDIETYLFDNTSMRSLRPSVESIAAKEYAFTVCALSRPQRKQLSSLVRFARPQTQSQTLSSSRA